MLLKKLVLMSLLAASLNACTSEEKAVEEVVAPAAEAKSTENEFKVDEQSGKLEFNAEIVYFGYDDSSLTDEGMARLDAIAKYMKENEGLKLNIEGHCDDRGSVEYNMALGQRRSDSVKKYLVTIGISADRLGSVSFGEEKPSGAGEGEAAWAKNRRAEFAFSKS